LESSGSFCSHPLNLASAQLVILRAGDGASKRPLLPQVKFGFAVFDKLFLSFLLSLCGR